MNSYIKQQHEFKEKKIYSKFDKEADDMAKAERKRQEAI